MGHDHVIINKFSSDFVPQWQADEQCILATTCAFRNAPNLRVIVNQKVRHFRVAVRTTVSANWPESARSILCIGTLARPNNIYISRRVVGRVSQTVKFGDNCLVTVSD